MTPNDLILLWLGKAKNAREEAVRIRQTVKVATDAEAYCNIRAEIWEQCADDLRRSIWENR
ncbi:MAG: hypothetical protein KGL39_20535 [Patescibacteria group bacterium]|nr:hypothetical protein [Patescibacteria group bacterium]